MTKAYKWLVAGGVVLLLVLMGLAVAGHVTLGTPVRLAEPQLVEIVPNASFAYVAQRLEDRKIIPSAFAFKCYARLTGKAEQLKVGLYEITDGLRPTDILDLLVSGHAKVYRLTIPEGKWASEIDGMLTTHWPDAAPDFMREIDNAKEWKAQVPFLLEGNTLEGYLFPDTYYFVKGVTGETIVAKMLERFQVTCWKAYQDHQAAHQDDKRTLHEVLVLASLVEGEARIATEGPTIAGVYINRLKMGMPLQCDATVLYAHGERLSRVLYKHLEVDSPYNTYRYQGLPPGPINNPGLSAFKSALEPAETPYLYYVARGDGSHIFSRTLAEHNTAIQRIRGK